MRLWRDCALKVRTGNRMPQFYCNYSEIGQLGIKMQKSPSRECEGPCLCVEQKETVCRHLMMCLNVIISIIGKLCSSFCLFRA